MGGGVCAVRLQRPEEGPPSGVLITNHRSQRDAADFIGSHHVRPCPNHFGPDWPILYDPLWTVPPCGLA